MAFRLDTLRLDQLTADPVSPENGDIWFNVTDGMYRLRLGGVTADLVSGVFGNHFTPADDDTESQTASTALPGIQKLRLTTPVVDAGTFIIMWQLQLRSSNNGRSVFAQVELDDADSLAGTIEIDRTVYDQFSGNVTRPLTAAGHTIDIDFRADTGPARTAFIRQAHMQLWRVL